jgi:hypothetical protein
MASNMKRGAIPSPRHKLAAAMPHQIVGISPPALLYNPPQLSIWGNDKYGDCVTAEEAFAKAAFNPEIFITPDEAVSWARSNGYLNGAVIVEVLEKMMSAGFQQSNCRYDDGSHTSVDWTNATILQNAIAQGSVKIGVAANQLEPVVTPGRNGWFATGFTQDNEVDHCVSLCGYGTMQWLTQQFKVLLPPGIDGTKPGYAMFTWDSIGVIDVASMLAITHEAWLRTPTSVIKST